MRQHNLRVTGSLTVNGENVVSASQLSALNSTLTGQYATTGSNMYNGNQTITGSVIVTGTITANEFHTTFVTSSVLYTSGSTKFGDTNDDIMEVTGSLKVDGNITANNLSGIVSGSSQITSLLPTGVVSGSSQLTASYDVRYVISGSITQTTWDNIASKPAGIVSSSAQVILQSTTGQLSASRVDGLNLTQIGSGSYTASIGQTFNVNTSTIITGSLSVSSLSGSGINYLAYSGGVVTAISGTAAIKYNQEFTATLGQTIFTPSVGYVSGLIDVYYNGTKLSTTDYTATNGSTIVLSQGADLAGDIIEVAIYNPVNGVSNNVLRQQTTFTASASQTTFTINYTPGLIDVFFNGSRLSNEEYTANNGTSIILSEATTGGEIIDIFVYSYQVGAFSGVGGQGVTNQLAYWSSQSGLTGSNSLTFDGTTLTISGSLVPAVSGAYDLGSTSKPFRHIYVGSGSIFLVNNEGQVTNTISAQSIVTTDTLNSGSIDLTKSLPTGTVSGSSQIVGILTSLNTATASFTPRITNLESKSASVDISITNINSVTASNIARLSNLESKSASVDITLSSINSKTGSYATTGSNSFYGTQVFSGSVYIANDLVVQGSSSIQYISASSVSIGTNIVQLNTANPTVRFAGLTVIDSGSIGGSGSFLYDSLQDEFIFVHRGNGTNVTSSHFVTGPETYDNLGNELYLTCNILTKGTGKEHLVDSCIFDNGTTTCIKNNLVTTGTISGTTIYGSTVVCSPVGLFSGCVGIGTVSPGTKLEVVATGENVLKLKNSGGQPSLVRFNDTSTTLDPYIGSYGNDLAFGTYGGGEKMRITSTGVACFLSTVCSPAFVGGTMSGTTIYGSTAVCSAVGKFTTCIDACSGYFSGNINSLQNLVLTRASTSAGSNIEFRTSSTLNWYIGTRGLVNNNFYIVNEGLSANNLILDASTGAATFTCQVNAESFYTNDTRYISNQIMSGYNANSEDSDIWINYTGYLGGTTRFRDFRVGNGKQGQIAFFDGSTGNVGISTSSPNYANLVICNAAVNSGNNSALTIGRVTSLPSSGADYGNIFLFSTDAYAADKGGTISFGSQYGSSGGETRMSGIFGGKENATNGDYSGYLSFYTRLSGNQPAERMRITSGGNAFFNRTTNWTTFGDSGGAAISSDANGSAYYAVNDGGESLGLSRRGSDGTIALFRRSTTTVGTISVNSSATAYNTSSDYRLKQDFNNFNGLNIISNLKMYDFQWKKDSSRSFGAIAHELEEVIPYAVNGEKDAVDKDGEILPQGVDYSKLVPVLVKAIQEQQCTIQCLTNRIEQLENK